MPRKWTIPVLAPLAATLWAGAAAAQPAAQPWEPRPRGTRVEQGVGDVGPLSVSPREPRVDLRLPTDFDGVFRLNPVDRFGNQVPEGSPFAEGGGLFMRTSGGLTAVFPRSSYIQTKGGLVPQIPAGTVFYLGELPEGLVGRARAPRRPDNFIDLSADLRADAPARTDRPGYTPPVPVPITELGMAPRVSLSIWSDDSFRQRRIGQLLSRLGDR